MTPKRTPSRPHERETPYSFRRELEGRKFAEQRIAICRGRRVVKDVQQCGPVSEKGLKELAFDELR